MKCYVNLDVISRQRLAFIIALLLLLAPVTVAQTNDFSLARNTVDNGGGTLSSGGFTLTGNIGQPDAAVGSLRNGGYTLSGGVFVGAAGGQDIYLPVILKNY